MNVFKRIILANKFIKIYIAIRDLAIANADEGNEIKNIILRLKEDFKALLAKTPKIKELVLEVQEIMANAK